MPTESPQAPVDICNLALSHCGEPSISSIEAPTNQTEELMALWYDQVRRTLLREYVWNFAQKYVSVSRSGAGEGGYEDAYALPNDFIRLNGVGEYKEYPITDYELGPKILYASEGNSVPIRYNRSITQVSDMDPLFINIFALRLALKVAYQITKKKSVVDEISGLLALEEPKAISVDGQERPPIRVERSKYLSARRRTGSRGASRYIDWS